MSQRSERKSNLFLLSVATFIFASAGLYAVFALFTAPQNPAMGGKKLSDHIYTAYAPVGNSPRRSRKIAHLSTPEQEVSRLAIRQLGAECIPLIQSWLTAEPTPWKQKLKRLAQRMEFNSFKLEHDRREMACYVALDLPEYSAPLVPQLLALATNQSFANPSLPIQALRAIRYKTSCDRTNVVAVLLKLEAEAISRYGRGTRREREVKDCLLSWDPMYPLYAASEWGQMAIVASLSELKKLPHRMIPYLINGLSSTNSAILENRAQGLGNYGPQASAALPALSNLLTHPKSYVRFAASNSIGQAYRIDRNSARLR